MAHTRRRQHYRVAQKANEAQECQHKEDHKRGTILLSLAGVILGFQIFNTIINIIKLISCCDSED
jgi:hypothetical protein